MSVDQAAAFVAAGDFRKAAELLLAKQNPTLFDKILSAWIELELGDPEEAHSQATSLLRLAKDDSHQAYCLAIAGRALGRCGSPQEGLALIRRSMMVASQRDPYLEALVRGHYTNSLLSWVGVEPALAELGELRRSALLTGNAHALVDFHIATARIAALRNKPEIVEKEINAALDLLENHPNKNLLWRVRELQAIAAILEGNARAAKEHSEECLSLAQEIGGRNQTAGTLANLAHIAASAGDFKGATDLLKRALPMFGELNPARFAAVSTGITVGLAQGLSEPVESMVRDGLAAMTKLGPDKSYYVLWFELHRSRWLLEQEKYGDALALANEAVQTVLRLADRALHSRFALLSAEALARSRRPGEADRLFHQVCVGAHASNLEVLAETLRVGAQLSARTHPVQAASQLAAAHRLLTFAGLRGVRVEVERTAARLGLSIPTTTPDTTDPATLLTRLGLLLRLGRHPWVLGRELVDLLRAHGVDLDAYFAEERDEQLQVRAPAPPPGRPPRRPHPQDVAIWLGQDGRTTYWLRAPRPTSTPQTLLWASISTMIEATLTLHGRQRDRDRTRAYWNDDRPPLQLGMVVAAERSLDLLNTARKLASSNITVLITGETGTGKELLARALHDASPRSARPFIPFNCSAVSREMLDAQLFGYRRGAFTGASEPFSGVIRAAAGGTLFLDEIGEVTPDVQPKLLRFLESGEIHPLGEPRPISVDVRVLAATNADLEKLVSEGRFREDLFYRLNVVRLPVPALRERREEIPPIVQHYLEKCSREAQKTGLRIADETMEYLILYRWPGNIRQLANEIRRMVTLAEPGAVLMPEHLSEAVAASRRTVPAHERPLAATELLVRLDQPLPAIYEHVDRSAIRFHLTRSGGNLEATAAGLGLSRKGLYLKRQRLGLIEPHEQDAGVPA